MSAQAQTIAGLVEELSRLVAGDRTQAAAPAPPGRESGLRPRRSAKALPSPKSSPARRPKSVQEKSSPPEDDFMDF